MTRSGKFAFGLVLVLILLLTYLEATEPEPVNWNPSYLETDKIALGSFVFYESWREHGKAEIENISIPPFEFLDQEREGTYFFLNNFIGFDDNELEKLLTWVDRGNSVFISADYISKNLLDTLNLKATTYRGLGNFVSRPGLNFVHPELQSPAWYNFTFDTEALYFNQLDTLNHTVLGLSTFKSDPGNERVNYIKAPFGKGEFFLHTNPQALGNYFLLTNDNYRYAEGVLSYIDSSGIVYWDKYYKAGKTFYTSPLYVLLNNKALKWAYYFILIGSVLFILFEGKRKQRPVPVVKPLKNQTFEYSRTIANLYLEQKNYRELALKKIEHFNDYIRTHYRLDTSHKDDKFYRELAGKTNNTMEDTLKLSNIFSTIIDKPEISTTELQELNNNIETFKKSQE